MGLEIIFIFILLWILWIFSVTMNYFIIIEKHIQQESNFPFEKGIYSRNISDDYLLDKYLISNDDIQSLS